ncbi:MAG TPA: hypothetical protein PK635_13495 [Actinomycetota bacterium]|nr:hypothetical protein [Actinomycetota bacterium]
MLIETIDARISRALTRLRQARFDGRHDLIADRERALDALLDLRLREAHQPCPPTPPSST